MARTFDITAAVTRVYIDDEEVTVDAIDDDGNKIPLLDGSGNQKRDPKDPATKLYKQEKVTGPKVFVIERGKPDPKEGTIFHLGPMPLSLAMRFTKSSAESRGQLMEDLQNRVIVGWERMKTRDDKNKLIDLAFDSEYVPYLPVFDRMSLVVFAAAESVSQRKKKGRK